MSLMHVNLGGSKRARHYSSLNHTASTGEQLEHSRSSPPADHRGGLIENDFRLLGGGSKRLRDGMCFIQIVCGFFSDVTAVSINRKSGGKKRERRRAKQSRQTFPFQGVPAPAICKEGKRKRKRSFSAGSVSLKCIH